MKIDVLKLTITVKQSDVALAPKEPTKPEMKFHEPPALILNSAVQLDQKREEGEIPAPKRVDPRKVADQVYEIMKREARNPYGVRRRS